MGFQEDLVAELQDCLPCFAELLDMRRLSKGVSKEMWDLKLSMYAQGNEVEGKQELRACLRRNPRSNFSENQLPLAVEAELCTLARSAGVPCPAVLCEMTATSRIGSAFLMEWIDGETLGAKILKDPALAVTREGLALDCGRALGKMHKIELSKDGAAYLSLPRADAATTLRQHWDSLKSMENGFGFSRPVLHFVLRWLHDRAPVMHGALCLCHGDFRLGNLVVKEKGLAAVLDWELATIGDPLSDLGWILTMAWRYGQPDKPVGGFGKLEDLIAGYEEQGHTVNEVHLRWWEIFSSVKWAVICLQQGVGFRSGRGTAENATVGRRASEGELDALALILGPQPDSVFAGLIRNDAEAEDRPRAPHDGIGPVEGYAIMEAGQGLLQQMMAALAKGSHAEYLGRVCGNLLNITIRELVHGHRAAQVEMEELRYLLDKDTLGDESASLHDLRKELSMRFQTDTASEPASSDLVRYLSRSVVRQLLFDSPKYFGISQICSPRARPRL